MILIIILLALLIEHYARVPDTVRKMDWFPRYVEALGSRYRKYSFWDGPVGVLLTLAGPMFAVALLVWALVEVFYLMAVVVSLVFLLFALGPRLNGILDDYVKALEAADLSRIQQLASELTADSRGNELPEEELLESVLLFALKNLFGILFWFIVLGPAGAVLYRLSGTLVHIRQDLPAYSETALNVYNILNWPVARLFALGNALTGNMVDALETWREVEQKSFAVNEQVVCASGIGALNYEPAENADTETLLEDRIYWIRALQGMLNRNLLVWLTVLGLTTLSGWVG